MHKLQICASIDEFSLRGVFRAQPLILFNIWFEQVLTLGKKGKYSSVAFFIQHGTPIPFSLYLELFLTLKFINEIHIFTIQFSFILRLF